MFPFITQGDNIIIYVDAKPHTISKSHANYAVLIAAIKAGDDEAVRANINVTTALTSASSGAVEIKDGVVYFKGEQISNGLTKRMLSAYTDGFPFEHFGKFMENLDANPSYRARNELIGFLDACDLPITEDGCFLAYKKINANWTDCYTGKMDNSIGKVVEMPRRDVNEDPTQTCSAGLHACSYSYLKSYGGQRIVAVKINPADVVSVPVDYNFAKLRTCKYEVVSELPFEASQNADILSTSKRAKSTNSYEIGHVLEYMDHDDFVSLCDYLGADADSYPHFDKTALMDDFKYGEIRRAIDALELV